MPPPALPPGAAGELGDARPELRVTDHDEHPRLQVLGTRGVGGRPEAPFDELVVDRAIGEPPGRPLAEDDIEERRRRCRVPRGPLYHPAAATTGALSGLAAMLPS